MNLIDAITGEHAAFYLLFDKIDEMAAIEGFSVPIQSATLVLGALVWSHTTMEEELLFPVFERHVGDLGPVEAMRAEHNEIERAVEEIEDSENDRLAAQLTVNALNLVRAHFRKEEEVYFELARNVLDHSTLMQLGRFWAMTRRGTLTSPTRSQYSTDFPESSKNRSGKFLNRWNRL